jgi:hypothetical protein
MGIQLLAILLAASLLLIGGVVFVAIARPAYLLGWVAWWAGQREAWRKDRLTERELGQYQSLILRSYPMLLVMVFAWAFLVGAVLAFQRL